MSYYMSGLSGMSVASGSQAGMAYNGFGAAEVFDGAQVWSDWVSGDTSRRAGTPNGLDNKAASKIQSALNTLGYGPLVVDGIWGSGSSGEFYKFATKENVAVNTGCPGKNGAKGSCPTQAGLARMGEVLASGGGKAQASMLMAGVGLLAAVGLGAVLMSKKRGRPPQQQAARARAV
jgi:hypothetical protein